MRNPDQDIAEIIFHDLQIDPMLDPAWTKCDSGMRDYLRIVIDGILEDTQR